MPEIIKINPGRGTCTGSPEGSVRVPRTEIIKINPEHPEPPLIARAAAILAQGGLIAYPTETFYGLGVHPGNAAAVAKIFRIKQRLLTNPIALILGDRGDIVPFVREVPEDARKLMERFWPGPLTIVFQASPLIIPVLTAGTGGVGIRISSHPVASAVANALSFPVTATSANISGQGECSTAAQVLASLGDQLDAVVDGGPTAGGMASTVVDMTSPRPVIVRAGAVPASQIGDVIGSAISM